MKEFVSTYSEDGKKAKAVYYLKKLKFDVNEEEGKKKLHKMLFTYLEGMQWVMFYYYRGAQHWRWYYPYHYAPMISDLGDNIVQTFLGGKTKIEQFSTDSHCSEITTPYSPFQQLLCILPVKSLKLCLPKEYAALAETVLAGFFPLEFEVDLNGRTLPWEAAILIPFANEAIFLEHEQSLYKNGFKLKEHEQIRNTISFKYPSFKFEEYKTKIRDKSEMVRLKSTLTHMKDLLNDCSTVEIQEEYEQVGHNTGF